MLSDHTPTAVLAVQDLARARAFYEGVLQFSGQEQMEGIAYRAGDAGFFVYPSQFAGTNQATVMTFEVDGGAFDEEVARLRAAGIDFDTFEGLGIEWADGVAVAEGMRAVWFRDPDGNVLNISTES
jgi:catechol 2,3-dioxygenase-like lactoylglutathione lyase family enzyme